MDGFKFTIGIILLIVAVVMYFYIEDIKDDRMGFFGSSSIEKITKMCDSGWGDAFNITGQCMKIQGFYYSPWISGFFGVLFLAKAGPYRGYHGVGGAGSHNRRIRLRRRTKKKIMILVVLGIILGLSIFLYVNYDITIANQRIDDIIPPGSIEKTLDDLSKGITDNIPVEIKERP